MGPAAADWAIDLSPITFAEYQLFIDDGRTRGENYAPDHWNSWEFLPRTANLPMVGARRSDANVFCSWLERGVGAGFKISLATPQEVMPLLDADTSLRHLRVLTDD
jgi:formylglycine-generating enzyme required for sulfatase activity